MKLWGICFTIELRQEGDLLDEYDTPIVSLTVERKHRQRVNRNAFTMVWLWVCVSGKESFDRLEYEK